MSSGKPTRRPRDLLQIGKIADGVQQVPNGAGGTVGKPGQDPAAGATVQKGVAVNVVVYKAKQIVLPQFTPGVTSLDDIRSAFDALGTRLHTCASRDYAPDPTLVGKFISMTPVADATPIDFNTPVTVTVYGNIKPPPPTTPDNDPEHDHLADDGPAPRHPVPLRRPRRRRLPRRPTTPKTRNSGGGSG